MDTFISILIVFSVLQPNGKWKKDHQVEFGNVETGSIDCRRIIKDVRKQIGKQEKYRFESAYCREVQQ